MTVNVPADNAERVGLRKVIDEEAVKKVVKYLTSGGTEMPKNWNRRFKHNRDKMKTGDIFELAEVVRNLSLRDGEKGLSTGEKQMYVKAKKILASELMYAKNLSEDDAFTWLEGVLTAETAPAKRVPAKRPVAAEAALAAKPKTPAAACRVGRERLGRARRRRAGRAARGRPSEGVCAPRRSSPARGVAAAARRERVDRRRSSSSLRRAGRSRRSSSPRSSARRRSPRASPGGDDALGLGADRARRGAGRRRRRARPRRGAAAPAARARPAAARGARARASTAPCRASRSPTRSSASATASSSRRPPRDELVAVQTPQAFVASVLRAAAAGEGSDCASLVEAAGGRVKVVPGDERLLKVTTPADLERVEALLAARAVACCRGGDPDRDGLRRARPRRRACRSCSAASSSSIRAVSPATPTAT